LPGLQSTDFPAIRRIDEIPIAHTPPGGYGAKFPDRVLAGCNGPLVPGAPDLRGMWQVIEVQVKGKPAPRKHSAYRHFERIEQCGDRMVVTGGGVIHDMRCDGTAAHGVHDVAVRDFRTKITVIATYENGVHVLRPVGFLVRLRAKLLGYNLVITRRRDGDDMIFTWATFTSRLRRIGGPDAAPPAM